MELFLAAPSDDSVFGIGGGATSAAYCAVEASFSGCDEEDWAGIAASAWGEGEAVSLKSPAGSGFPEAKNYSPSGYLPASSLTDPWGTPFVYISTERGFELLSLARDGVEGGEGYDADIHYKAQ
jgi:hypothetical protein